MFFRLVVIWRELYRLALRYQEELCLQRVQRVVKNELEKMSVIIPQVQQALQSAGDRLEESHTLLRFTGEHEEPSQKCLLYHHDMILMFCCCPSSGEQHFISGEYAESVQVWRTELCAEMERGQPLFSIQPT